MLGVGCKTDPLGSAYKTHIESKQTRLASNAELVPSPPTFIAIHDCISDKRLYQH